MAKSTRNLDGVRITLEITRQLHERIERLRGVLRSRGLDVNVSNMARDGVEAGVAKLEKEHGK